jgi:hypothetical protein
MTMQIGSSPDPSVADAARRYSREAGLLVPREPTNFGNVAVSHSQSDKVGDAYLRLPHFDRGALPAYRAMREEVGRQFDFMTRPEHKGGLGMSVNVTSDDPYQEGGENEIFRRFRNDVTQNRHIDVLSTKTTGGHPFFSDDENDMFRAVHDVFGHLGSGRAIDRHGEDAAYQKHAEMFTPLARRALATETRGQNGALHRTGEFQDQKVALLPDHMQSMQFMRRGTSGAERAEAAFENRKHGVL